MVLWRPSKTCKSYNYVASQCSSPSIMHDRAVVIRTIEIVCHLFLEVMRLFCQNIKTTTKIKDIRYIICWEHRLTRWCNNIILGRWSFLLTWYDVFPYNWDIVVSVWARLLMHKAKGVHELVGSHSWPHAPRSLQWQGLASSSLPQKRPAAWGAEQKWQRKITTQESHTQSISRQVLHVKATCNSHTHPYLGWISRKLPSWVRGTNLTHVPEEMSCIPVSMVILSMLSTIKKQAKFEFNIKIWTKCLCNTLLNLWIHTIQWREDVGYINKSINWFRPQTGIARAGYGAPYIWAGNISIFDCHSSWCSQPWWEEKHLIESRVC